MRKVKVKPSKGQSIAGMIGGIVFVGIGLFVVIPTFGPFGFLWTLFAVVATGINAYNVFSEDGIANYEIDIEDHNCNRTYNNYSDDSYYENVTKNEATKETQMDFDEKLRKIKKLRDDEVITEEEFQHKREEILNEKW